MEIDVVHMPTLLEPLKDLKKYILYKEPNKHLAWPNKKLECNHIIILSHWKISNVFNPKKNLLHKKITSKLKY
jgi:hypothetical protein